MKPSYSTPILKSSLNISPFPPFSHNQHTHILFGPHTCLDITQHYGLKKKTVLMITGLNTIGRTPLSSQFLEIIKSESTHLHIETIRSEPTASMIDTICQQYRSYKIDVVIAIGGGSVMDAGKAIAAMLKETQSIETFLEGIGQYPASGKTCDCIAIPTTAGTGSEVTHNAVISGFPDKTYKKSLRHINYTPTLSIIDPSLTLSCPPHITYFSGMDAFTQLIESLFSTKANPISQSLALTGIHHFCEGMPLLEQDSQDLYARTQIALASLLSGTTLSSAGLGLVHGFASVIGSMFEIPHGLICATLLAETMRLTFDSMKTQDHHPKLQILIDAVAHSLPDPKKSSASSTQITDQLLQWQDRFKIPKLSKYGVTDADIDTICQQTGLKNHPVKLTPKQCEIIIKRRI